MEAGFRTRYRLSVIGVKRGTEPVMGDVQSEPLRAGDTLLVAGPWRAITRLKTDPNEIIVLHVPVEAQEVVPLPWRAPFALGVLAVVLGLMIFNVVPNVLAGLIGCFLLGVFRCVDVNAAYRSIQWPTVFLIVGMLPFSTALQKTGGVDLVVQALSGAVRGADPVVMLAALYGLTALLGLFISNTATAVLMAPVAIALAEQLGQPPHAFAMAVALASSAAFITPVSSPVNVLVVGPGNYRFMDFVRIGLPLFFLVMVLSLVLIRLVYLSAAAPAPAGPAAAPDGRRGGFRRAHCSHRPRPQERRFDRLRHEAQGRIRPPRAGGYGHHRRPHSGAGGPQRAPLPVGAAGGRSADRQRNRPGPHRRGVFPAGPADGPSPRARRVGPAAPLRRAGRAGGHQPGTAEWLVKALE